MVRLVLGVVSWGYCWMMNLIRVNLFWFYNWIELVDKVVIVGFLIFWYFYIFFFKFGLLRECVMIGMVEIVGFILFFFFGEDWYVYMFL